MARRKKKNEWAGIIVGPLLVIAALSALWKNETRYDYYRAARNATEISALAEAEDQQIISYTGPMDKSLMLNGKYIKDFTGYLVIRRHAEIYCWDKDEDSDGHTDWDLEWQSSIESNSRNSGLQQRLKSGQMIPDNYNLGELEITSDQIEFVDSFEAIAPTGELTELPITGELRRENNYLMLHKNGDRGLGDERISYRGLAVPSTATWFGKYAGGKGLPHDAEKRDGWINQLIQDTGVLHHLVAGDRDTALATTKQYLSQLKWIIRGIGTVLTFFGFLFFFGTIAKVLYRVPVIGWVAEKGAFLLALVVGISLSILTIVCGYLFGHLFLLFGILAVLGAFLFLALRVRKQNRETSKQFHQALEVELCRELNFDDIKEMEFAQLAHLALSDSKMTDDEMKFLYKWGKQNGWSTQKVDELLQEVKNARSIPDSEQTTDEHLNQLIKLALADGQLSSFEMQTIRLAAKKAGFDRKTVAELMDHVQQSAS